MGISGRLYGKSVLARSFSFQRLPAEKIRNEERLIREAKVRLVREINRLGVVRGNGRSRKVNWPDPDGPGRWEGQHRQLIREPEERGGVPQVLERHLGGPPGLMKIFKLR